MRHPPSDEPVGRGVQFNLSAAEHTNFSLSHKHSGIHGDGQKILAASLDWTGALAVGLGIVVTTPDGKHAYRIGVANNGALTTTKII